MQYTLAIATLFVMNTKYQSGQVVRLMSGAGEIERVVVSDLGEVLLICRREEYELARAENRVPARIGFRRTDVIK